MIEPKTRDEIKAEIAKRIAAGDADSNVVLATTILSLVVPVMEEIAGYLGQITLALGPDKDGASISERIRGIETFLGNWMQPLLRQLTKEDK